MTHHLLHGFQQLPTSEHFGIRRGKKMVVVPNNVNSLLIIIKFFLTKNGCPLQSVFGLSHINSGPSILSAEVTKKN